MARKSSVSQPIYHATASTRLISPSISDTTPTQDTVIFTSFDGEDFEIPDLPENLARITALASEKTLSKIWDTTEEEDACRNMSKEM